MESGTPQLRTDTPETTPVDVSKLGFHVITTQDVSAIAEHYEAALQLVRTGEEGDTVYLTTAGDHHAVGVTGCLSAPLPMAAGSRVVCKRHRVCGGR